MGNVRNFRRLRSSRYYNIKEYQKQYANSQDLLIFIGMLENIDINQLRYIHKKELLKVLEYIFEKYRLFVIPGKYMDGFVFNNKFVPFEISEREYIVLEYIINLKEQPGGYYMKYYNFYYNVALNYIENCKRYILIHKKLADDKPLENTNPRFLNFPGECCLNEKYSIDKAQYKDLDLNEK